MQATISILLLGSGELRRIAMAVTCQHEQRSTTTKKRLPPDGIDQLQAAFVRRRCRRVPSRPVAIRLEHLVETLSRVRAGKLLFSETSSASENT
jgi:hypothetical protein